MTWIHFGILSAIGLGVYDLCKKRALHQNAVFPVLFLSSLTGTLFFLPFLFLSLFHPTFSETRWYIPAISLHMHLLIVIKSLIVTSSWVFAYFAMKHLPISIVSPIRASAPVWVILGALFIFQERPGVGQWVGIVLIFIAYFLFSRTGKKEGIHFQSNKWVGFIVLSTIIGSCSSLYDKYLINHIHGVPLQAYYTFYSTAIFLIIMVFAWYPRREKTTRFSFRASVVLIGVALALADIAYFQALSMNGSLISILSVLRRSNVIISFTVGSLLFREVNIKQKAGLLFMILAGVMIIAFFSK